MYLKHSSLEDGSFGRRQARPVDQLVMRNYYLKSLHKYSSNKDRLVAARDLFRNIIGEIGFCQTFFCQLP